MEELEARGLKTELPCEQSDSSKEVAGRLTLFFTQGNGDLRRDVPPFR